MIKKKLSNETVEFLKNCRNLVDHAACMQLATGYRQKFNYGYFSLQLQRATKELGSEEDAKEIYPSGL